MEENVFSLGSVLYLKSKESSVYLDLPLGSIWEYWFDFTHSSVHTYGVSSVETPLWDTHLF